MVTWENKAPTNQTWANLQAYFTKEWHKRNQYSATTAKQSCFKEALLQAQETAATEEEGETQAMLFCIATRTTQQANGDNRPHQQN
jgi:hypothetical protein